MYIYLGGGAVDSEQSRLLLGAVVLAKDWRWAAMTVVASWMLTCCCACGTPLLADPDLFVTEDDDGKTGSDPLKDEELEPGPEAQPATASREEEEPAAEEEEGVDRRVSEKSRRQRKEFYRECQWVADKFVERVPGWPWKPGQEQEAIRTPEERARRGHESTTLFLGWMAQIEQVRMALIER